MNVLSLPQDILTVILSILPVRDIARCRRCCVLFHTAACDKTLWAQLLRRDFPLSEIKSGDSPEALYRSLSEWCFEPTFFSVNSTQVESASRVDQPYQVPHAKRVMTTGVHSWEIIIHNAGKTPTTNNWYFVGVGTHASASCGSYDKRGSACLDKNAYVLGFDGHLYQAAKACGSVKEKQRPGCYGMVLDCNKHTLHYFLDGKYLGHMPVPAEPLVAIVEVGRDNSASIRPPSRDYTHVALD